MIKGLLKSLICYSLWKVPLLVRSSWNGTYTKAHKALVRHSNSQIHKEMSLQPSFVRNSVDLLLISSGDQRARGIPTSVSVALMEPISRWLTALNLPGLWTRTAWLLVCCYASLHLPPGTLKTSGLGRWPRYWWTTGWQHDDIYSNQHLCRPWCSDWISRQVFVSETFRLKLLK